MTDISTLEGQDLRDAIAAAKGWQRMEDRSGVVYWRTQDGRDVHPAYLPKWDSSLAAAFGLLSGYEYTIESMSNGEILVVHLYTKADYDVVTAEDPSLAIAICRAWLAMKQAQAVTT